MIYIKMIINKTFYLKYSLYNESAFFTEKHKKATLLLKTISQNL